jgi:hypothetical protein
MALLRILMHRVFEDEIGRVEHNGFLICARILLSNQLSLLNRIARYEGAFVATVLISIHLPGFLSSNHFSFYIVGILQRHVIISFLFPL